MLKLVRAACWRGACHTLFHECLRDEDEDSDSPYVDDRELRELQEDEEARAYRQERLSQGHGRQHCPQLLEEDEEDNEDEGEGGSQGRWREREREREQRAQRQPLLQQQQQQQQRSQQSRQQEGLRGWRNQQPFQPQQQLPPRSALRGQQRANNNNNSNNHNSNMNYTSSSKPPTPKAADETHQSSHLTLRTDSLWHGGGGAQESPTSATAATPVAHVPATSSRTLTPPAVQPSAAPASKRQSLRESLILCNEGRLEDHYTLKERELGKGGFGLVRRAVHIATGEPYAVKTIRKLKIRDMPDFQREIEITRSMDHFNIVKLFATFEDEQQVHLVMELCAGGELFDRMIKVGRATNLEAASCFRQICRAVAFVHSHHIVHRDIKAENFLLLTNEPLADVHIKLIDFGLAKRCEPGSYLKSCVGTPAYAAPEVLSGKHYTPCDLWSCGVLLYMLLSGCAPFDGNTRKETLKRVVKGQYSMEHHGFDGVSEKAKALVCRLLERKPEERATALEVLTHPWILESIIDRPIDHLGPAVVENIRRYTHHCPMKKAALTVIVSHMNDGQLKALNDIFFQLDTTLDGTVSVEELRTGFERMSLAVPDDLDELVLAVDSSGKGRIDYTEFLAAAIDSSSYTSEDACRSVFKHLDRDPDKIIARTRSGGTKVSERS